MTKEKQTKPPARVLTAKQKAECSKTRASASTSPTLAAASTRNNFMDPSLESLGDMAWTDHWKALAEKCKMVSEGDMAYPEAMLLSQAMTLEAIFNRCASLAGHNMMNHLTQGETLLRMALRAQSQCTQTLRVLGELKSPRAPATFVKQQNNANGNQQVNNGPVTQGATAHAHGEKETPVTTNELLTDDTEAQHAAMLDSGATSRAGRENQTLEAVGVRSGTGDRSRQGHGVTERVETRYAWRRVD